MIGFFTLLRTIISLWVAIEFSNVAYIYWYGYKKYKPTPIIRSLQILFFLVSLYLFFISFIPIILEVDPKLQRDFINLVLIFLVPLGFAVRKFRKESIEKNKIGLPKEK